MQFSLLSLIPGLIRNLQDSADPDLNNYEKSLSKPTSLRTSDRNSLLSYMGLPLQIFGKVRFFGCRNWIIILIDQLGESVWSLHPFTTTRHPCRLWHQVLRRRKHKLPSPPTKGPLQRHSHQPRRKLNQHHLYISQNRPYPHRCRSSLDRLRNPRSQRDVG